MAKKWQENGFLGFGSFRAKACCNYYFIIFIIITRRRSTESDYLRYVLRVI